MILTVICALTKHTFAVTQEEARELELKLNVTSRGSVLRSIGDELYNFHTNATKDAVLNVTDEEYLFLKRLNAISSWRECQNLTQ